MKNFGWIHQDKEDGEFWAGWCGYLHKLRNAHVFSSRSLARKDKRHWETIRKVSLTKTGKPKKIIGRG